MADDLPQRLGEVVEWIISERDGSLDRKWKDKLAQAANTVEEARERIEETS